MAGRRSTFVFLFAFLAAFVPVASGTTSSVYQDVIEQCAEEIAACAADSECLTCLSSYNNIPDTCSNTSSTSTDACEISGEVICCTFEESQDCLDSDLVCVCVGGGCSCVLLLLLRGVPQVGNGAADGQNGQKRSLTFSRWTS